LLTLVSNISNIRGRALQFAATGHHDEHGFRDACSVWTYAEH